MSEPLNRDANPTTTESEKTQSTRPPEGQIALAKLIVKREKEGKGKIKVTDEMRRVAAYDL